MNFLFVLNLSLNFFSYDCLASQICLCKLLGHTLHIESCRLQSYHLVVFDMQMLEVVVSLACVYSLIYLLTTLHFQSFYIFHQVGALGVIYCDFMKAFNKV